MSTTIANVSSAVTRSARVQTLVSILLLLGLWVFATSVLGVPSFTLPTPPDVATAWWDAAIGGGLFSDILTSARRLLLGVAAGISTGIAGIA